jgi:DNA-binding CsgD family transcriptional regulator
VPWEILLTHAELRVANLVAAGLTSKEVADHMFLSPRTVDNHLYRVFRKLGICSRRELRQVINFRRSPDAAAASQPEIE